MAIMGTAGLLVAGCDKISQSSWGPKVLGKAQGLNRRVQALLSPSSAMAKEYTEADISPTFHPNGTTMPDTDEYQALMANNFRDYKLKVTGLVSKPGEFSIDDLKKLDNRTQITRHDCVEGWSAIAQWTGPQLGGLLHAAGLQPHARYVVFHCADNLGGPGDGGKYYESIDLFDAFHPQTILAHAMNNRPLAIPHGAPIRLRVERQLGYKQAKYVMAIEVTDRLNHIGGGKGGFWEDRGYEWYAGI